MIRPIFILLIFFGLTSKAQTTSVILSKVYEQYSSDNELQFDTSYDLFKTHESEQAYQSYTGIFYKNENNDAYIKIKDTEIFNTRKANLKISHLEKMVLVSDPELRATNDFDVSKLLEFYKEEKISDQGDFWKIQLIANQPTLPYSRIVLHVSKEYLIQKQVFYHSNSMNFSDNFRKSEISTPRLEVSYSNYSQDPLDKNKLDTSLFLDFEESGKIVLKGNVKNYEVLDKRQGLN